MYIDVNRYIRATYSNENGDLMRLHHLTWGENGQ